jgi:predicted flap endonuclease-1-like 5' DNA nuclease
MSYTLMKGLGWFLAAFVLGIVIGWLLRSVTAKRQVARARAHHVDTVELERLRGRVANLDSVVAECDRLRGELDELRVATASAVPDQPPPIPEEPEAPAVPATPDMAEARKVLGRSVVLDDLKVIPGIGPKVENLCHGIGIRTWFDLSTTEVSLLRTMLNDAGPRFKTHDPTLWPEQARLLAEGRWSEFVALGQRAAEPSPAGGAPADPNTG